MAGRVDGRIGYAPHGLNVGGEPCVWCGGGPGVLEGTLRQGWEALSNMKIYHGSTLPTKQ